MASPAPKRRSTRPAPASHAPWPTCRKRCTRRSSSTASTSTGREWPSRSPITAITFTPASTADRRRVPLLSLNVGANPAEGDPMPTYVMLTNLTADGVRTLKNNPGRVSEVNAEVEQIGAKVLRQYATLGQYDFITIVEAPDEQTMAKVSVELGSRGTMTSQTLTAMSADDLAGAL